MLVELGGAVEGLDPAVIGADPSALGDAFAIFERYQARLVDAVGRFDVDGLWACDNATSMTAWLKGFARLSGPTAGGWVTLARRLGQFPGTTAAFDDGRLSRDQIRALLACVDADLTDLYAEHEVALIPILTGLSVTDITTVMRQWHERARAERPDPAPPEEKRSVHLSPLPDGSWRLDGHLTGEDGALVDHAIKTAMSPDAEGEPVRTAPQRRADALVDIVRWYLEHRSNPPSTRHRPHLGAIIGVDDLLTGGPGVTPDGQVLAAQAIQRWACDCTVSRVLTQGRSHILDYGYATRTVPVALYRAVVARDRHCRWPGCDRTPDWCQAHHLHPWTRHGPTHIDNLALFCHRHHHRVHEPGWHAKLDPYDATLTITMPTGRVLTSRPPPLNATLAFDSG